MVPRQMVHSARANLASAGVSASVGPQGYELLDNAGLSVSDFRQQVDYKRALEGELAMTLMAMEAVSSADVLLVLPEEALFIEDQEPVTASVLVDTVRPLGVGTSRRSRSWSPRPWKVWRPMRSPWCTSTDKCSAHRATHRAPWQSATAISGWSTTSNAPSPPTSRALLDAMYGAATSTPLREQLWKRRSTERARLRSGPWESTAKRSGRRRWHIHLLT